MSCFLHKESSLNSRQALIEQKLIKDDSSYRLNNVIRFKEWLANVVGEIKKYYGIDVTLYNVTTIGIGSDSYTKAQGVPEDFAKIDEIRKQMGIYDTKENVVVHLSKNQSKFQMDEPTTQPAADRDYVESVLTRLKDKFGIDYEVSYEPDQTWKGKYENNKVYINLAVNVTKDTPLHEYLHPFVSVLKKENQSLYNSLITQLQTLEAGKEEINNTKASPAYSKYSEEEILDEALVSLLGKLGANQLEADGNPVVEQTKQSMLKRFSNWLRGILNKVFSIKLSNLDLQSSLQDIATLVTTGKVKFDLNAGRLNLKTQFQHAEHTNDFISYIKGTANDIQSRIIDELYSVDNPNRVVLDQESHVYTHIATGQQLKSVTTAIKGELVDPENLYELNRLFGGAFDKILQNIIQGKSFEDSKEDYNGLLDEDIAKRAYSSFKSFIIGLTSDGSVVLPQIIVSDLASGIAGSLDILVISPEGRTKVVDLKVSKNSVKDPRYSTVKHDVNTASTDPMKSSDLKGERLTTKAQHGIQVAAYKRLVEIAGYPVDDTITVHILLKLEGEGKDQTVKDFEWENIQQHLPSENQDYVDVFIKTQPDLSKFKEFEKASGNNNPANDADFLDEEEAKPEEEIPQDLYKQISATVDKYTKTLTAYRDYFENLRNSTTFHPKQATVDKINELLAAVDTFKNQGKADLAFGRMLNYTKDQLQNIYNFLDNPNNKKNKDFIDVVLHAEAFINSYRGLAQVPKLGFGNREQLKTMRDVLNLLDGVQDQINPALEEHVMNVIASNSDKELTDDELKQLIKEGFDISSTELNLSDIDSSTDKILATAAKIYKAAIQRAKDSTQDTSKEIKDAGAKLASASPNGKPDYSFMLVHDKDGKFTGKYVQAIGDKYYELKKALGEKLRGDDGELMRYIEINDLQTADPKDLEFNRKLYDAKQVWSEFMRAEETTETGYTDGEFHKYNDEFKKVRSYFQDYINGYWVPKTNISEQRYKEQFLFKYHNRVEYTKAVKEIDGTFQGRTEHTIGYFPKSEYIQINEITSKGQDMRHEKYIKLMNPTTNLEKAQSEFYKSFIKIYKEKLSVLPLDVQTKMLGELARVKGGLMESAKRKGGGFIKAMSKSFTSWFDLTPKIYSMQRATDETGLLGDSLPVMYTGSLKNEQRIKEIEEQVKALKKDHFIDKKLDRDEYKKQLDVLQQTLHIEQAKIASTEFNLDLVENIEAFSKMADMYDQMSHIENTLLSLAKVVENKDYYQTDSLGRKFLKKGSVDNEAVTIEGKDSKAYKRFKKWFKMVYYNNDEYDASTIAQVAQKYQNMTSLKGMGLNVFGGLNNLIMGRINNSIEAFGGILYDKDAYNRSGKEFNRDYIPGMMRRLGQKTDGYYAEKKPESKYEALVKQFRMIHKYQADSGKLVELEWAYAIQEGGEFNIQSRTGMAVLMSKKFMVKNQQTGETMAVYDAYDFNSNTKELTLKPGFKIEAEDRHKITNYIYEVNKQIHGNYAWEDRAAIQSHWLGQLAFQFHKWIVPSMKARFQETYEHQVLGTLEGRYRTFWNLMNYAYQTEGSIFNKLKTSWNDMTDLQKRNMYKNAAEIGYLMASVVMIQIFKMLAAGVPPEDKNLKKLMNFMRYQGTRQTNEILTLMPVFGIQEQYQLVKSPIAVLGTMKEHAEAVAALMAMPFPPYDKNYYERGPYKGDLKAWKQAKDAIPVLGLLNRWESFETVKSFYIK